MNLATAIAARDADALPGRRDEDWRWTDLRGLIRTVPAPSAPLSAAEAGEGPFAGLAERTVRIAARRSSGYIGPAPITPSPPARATANASSAFDEAQLMPACTIG